MYYVGFLSLLSNPENEWDIILSEAAGAPPVLLAFMHLREYQRYTRYNAMDNIICSTDILWHYGHFAQDVSLH